MRGWLLLFGGLLIWAVHFFLLYGFASSFPGMAVAHWLTLAATGATLAANAAIIYATSPWRTHGDAVDHWIRTVGFGGASLSSLAVIWQGLSALFWP